MKNTNSKKKKNLILEFSCKGCGNCCKEKGYVFFNESDISKAAKYLNLNPLVFINKYLDYDDSLGHHIKVDGEKRCHFLDEKDKCIIHKAKPTQCETFPYWKEYTDKNGNLISDKFNRHCKGVKVKNN